MSAVQNIDAVINGEEELPEAILNVGIDTAKAAASSYGTAIAVKSAESLTKTVGEEVIKRRKNRIESCRRENRRKIDCVRCRCYRSGCKYNM